MSSPDSAVIVADCPAWKADVLARLRDLLQRKAIPTGEEILGRFGRTLQRFEGAVSTARWRTSIREFIENLRHRDAPIVKDQLEELHSRILRYRENESIQNYGEFLFTVDVRI